MTLFWIMLILFIVTSMILKMRSLMILLLSLELIMVILIYYFLSLELNYFTSKGILLIMFMMVSESCFSLSLFVSYVRNFNTDQLLMFKYLKF